MIPIEVRNLTRKYGSLTAVDDFSLTVGESEIVALVGPDGAGKTSLFRSICGLIHFDSGEVYISGYSVTADFEKIKPLLGYMPQTFSLYPDLSVEENLRFYAGLFGLSRDEFEIRKQSLYRFSRLGPFCNRRAADLSGGMKQKLALSCNLIHNPKIFILDEPTTGVDPLSRRQFWDILKSLRDDGSSIAVSTPYMDEVTLANRAVFIHGGKKLAEGAPNELAARYRGNVFRLQVEPTADQMHQLKQIDGINAHRFGASVHLYASETTDRDEIVRELSAVGIAGDLVEKIPAELEDVFIQLMGSRN